MSSSKRIKLDKVDQKFYSVLPDELTQETPLEEVYIDDIVDPKNISRTIIELNTALPLPELNHLKRVKGKSILLFPRSRCKIQDVHESLRKLKFCVELLADNVRVVSVAKIPPKVRHQYDIVNKLWPCNFHSDKYLEKLYTNTLFSEHEVMKHEMYMKVAIELCRFACDIRRGNGVVVVDPTIDSIVAVGCDNLSEGPCQHAVMVAIDNVAKTQNGGVWNMDTSVACSKDASVMSSEAANVVPSEAASVMSSEATSVTSSGVTAVMSSDVTSVMSSKDSIVALPKYGTVASSEGSCDLCGVPSAILNHLRDKFEDLKFGARRYKTKCELEVPSDGPYLCTGYYVYSVLEPCIMCSMALVHSRIRRVFYGIRTGKGGLGSLCKVHTVKYLNHHFEVFGGVLSEECLALELLN